MVILVVPEAVEAADETDVVSDVLVGAVVVDVTKTGKGTDLIVFWDVFETGGDSDGFLGGAEIEGGLELTGVEGDADASEGVFDTVEACDLAGT